MHTYSVCCMKAKNASLEVDRKCFVLWNDAHGSEANYYWDLVTDLPGWQVVGYYLKGEYTSYL